jgi:SAM-dependent methyltransferase
MTDWWEGFFGTEAWQAVQLGWSSLEDSADQVERVVRALALEPGARVLDVPCGDGRLAIELAGRGFAVTGVDRTPRFLEAGRARAAELGVEVDLREADMRQPVGVTGFDAAVCFWGSFGYFDDEGNRSQAVAACDALRPGGRFLIDTVSVESLASDFRPRNWFESHGTTVTMETSLDLGASRVDTAWTFLRPGEEPVTRRSSVRAYTLHELTELLHGVGFVAFTALDDALEPFELGADRLWLIATKGDG